MTQEKILQAILKRCDKSINKLPYFLNLINTNFASYRSCNISMFNMNELNWHKEYLYHHDIKATKQRIYNCGRLLDMRGGGRNNKMYHDLLGDVISMLLSDSQELLELFKAWEYDDYTHPNSKGSRIVSMTTFVQKLLRGNPKEISQEYELYLQHRNQRYSETSFYAFEKDPQIMKGFIEGDKDAIVDGLNWIVSERAFEVRQNMGACRYFSYPATAYLKVAWILGYEIEIDSSLIPMHLMPIQPLEKYEVPYFFMEGYEGEYPAGWLEWKANEAQHLFEGEMGHKLGRLRKWDETKYSSQREAIVELCAQKKGYRTEKDAAGNIHVYTKGDKKLGMWRKGTILRLEPFV